MGWDSGKRDFCYQTDEISFCRSPHNISDTKTGLKYPYEKLHKNILWKFVFSELYWYTFGEGSIFRQKFRFFGHLNISAKILKDFPKKNYFEKNEVRVKKIQKNTIWWRSCRKKTYWSLQKRVVHDIWGWLAKKKHVRLLLMKKSRKIKNLTKIQLKSILAPFWSVQKSGMLFFSSNLQILCTTRFCKLQYVLLRHDYHHTVFFA